MPGMDAREPERTETRSGRDDVAELEPYRSLEARESGLDLLPEPGGVLAIARADRPPRPPS